MSDLKPEPVRKPRLARRQFITRSLTASVGASLAMSLEEHTLLAQPAPETKPKPIVPAGTQMPMGQIGNVKIGRVICGGNLVSGYAHSRDLIYVSAFLKHYFTDDRIMQTWEMCEQHGINTMICYPTDKHAVEVYRRYAREFGGKIQYLAQIAPKENDIETPVKQAVDTGAAGVFLVGNLGDKWTRQGKTHLIDQVVSAVKKEGLIVGVAAHELRTTRTIEEAGIAPDFYMKTLHSTDYWSKRQPHQTKEVIDNYAIDNYWCMDPNETVAYMATVKRPWIAYKVLAAGAIHPMEGFRYAFEKGADFLAVGMFDFQITEDTIVARKTLALDTVQNRSRPWYA